MKNYIDFFLTKIAEKDSKHVEKLKLNLAGVDSEYSSVSDLFFEKYEQHLLKNGLTLEFGLSCYMKMIADMLEHRKSFLQTGKYSNTSFAEVEKSIYSNPEVMTYHMHGLVLAQFLWFDQYERIRFFRENLKRYFSNGEKYLEIGGGHGLYINEAVNLLPNNTQFDMVDISESSLALAKGILNTDKVNYYLKNIFDFTKDDEYDFITVGEVLEHLENPLELLQKIRTHLSKDGVCFLTTPVNSPMIDHIYLFNEVSEIRSLLENGGFVIQQEHIVISEKLTEKLAKKFKAPIMYAVFIKSK